VLNYTEIGNNELEMILKETVKAGRSRVRVPMRSLNFFNLPNPSSRTMTLGSTQPLTKMSTRNILGGKERPARL
jgi:hypothetical protein